MTDSASPASMIRTLTLAVIVIGSNAFVLSPILDVVAKDLGTEPVIIARAISAFGGATVLGSLFLAGRAAHFGIRTILSAGALSFIIAFLLSAISPNWIVLAAAQALAGLTVGIVLPTIYVSATSIAPPGQTSRVVGNVLRGWGISLVLGVPFSAFVTELVGWRFAYLILAAVSLLAFFGFRRLPKRTGSQSTNPPRLLPTLRIPGVLQLLAICLMFMIGFYSIYPFLGTRLADSAGTSAGQAGLVVLAYGLGFALAGQGAFIIDKFGALRIFPFALLCAASAYFILVPATASYWSAFPAAFIWGLFNQFAVNLIVQMLSARSHAARPVLMGLQTTMTYSAVFIGPLMTGFIYPNWGFAPAGCLAGLLLLSGALIAWVNRTHFAKPGEEEIVAAPV